MFLPLVDLEVPSSASHPQHLHWNKQRVRRRKYMVYKNACITKVYLENKYLFSFAQASSSCFRSSISSSTCWKIKKYSVNIVLYFWIIIWLRWHLASGDWLGELNTSPTFCKIAASHKNCVNNVIITSFRRIPGCESDPRMRIWIWIWSIHLKNTGVPRKAPHSRLSNRVQSCACSLSPNGELAGGPPPDLRSNTLDVDYE